MVAVPSAHHTATASPVRRHVLTLSLRFVVAVGATLILWGAGHETAANAGQTAAPVQAAAPVTK